MKKILSLLVVATLLIGCSNKDEDPATVNESLKIAELVSYVGKDPDYVKNHFNTGSFIAEGGTLGKTELSYLYKTNDTEYRVYFSTNTDNEIISITATGSFQTYSTGVEVYKKEMDLINSTVEFVTYRANYVDKYIGTASFDDRVRFWEYVAEKDVNSSVTEIWWLVNDAPQYFTIHGTYDRASNKITVLIENKVF